MENHTDMNVQDQIESRLPAIKALTDPCGISIEGVDYIPCGRTNESYVVHANGKKYLARIAGQGTEAIIDRERERHNVETAWKIGVAPTLYCARDGNLLLEYVEGVSTTDHNILLDPAVMEKVTTQMRRLHIGKEAFQGTFDFIHDYETYRRDFLSTGCPVPLEMREHEEELFALTKWVSEELSDEVCPCHGDIVLQNFIIGDERAYIVDWEYSASADRYLDLASFCIQNDLDKPLERLFLDSYFSGAAMTFDYEKFVLYKMAISFMWVYWHMSNEAHNKQPEYNGPRWRQRLQNALDNKREWEALRSSPSA